MAMPTAARPMATVPTSRRLAGRAQTPPAAPTRTTRSGRASPDESTAVATSQAAGAEAMTMSPARSSSTAWGRRRPLKRGPARLDVEQHPEAPAPVPPAAEAQAVVGDGLDLDAAAVARGVVDGHVAARLEAHAAFVEGAQRDPAAQPKQVLRLVEPE